MRKKRPFRWGAAYGAVLAAFSLYVLLDTFLIPRTYQVVAQSTAGTAAAETSVSTTAAADTAVSAATGTTVSAAAGTAAEPVSTDTSYSDGSVSITLSTLRVDDTDVYVADVVLSDPSALQTAFAQSAYGKNITQTTSAIAESAGAVLAVNGDFYGARTTGYVIRNGVLYRSAAASADQQDLVIWADGTFEIITEGEVTAEELLDRGAQQVLSFGPALLENGEVQVDANDEVDQAMSSNPRTAIGQISALHYVFVVADGRTSQSAGLTLQQLAAVMQSLGVQTAYNLDGGGSSTMVFNGTVVNNPTTTGRIQERKVSDIVYIA